MAQQRSLESLPIDIHYNKLLDWLTNRRHCGQQCQAILTVVRDKLQKAREATLAENHPDNQIQELLSIPQLNYFQVKELFEKLKSTDVGKKNLIGQYTNQSMKNWAEILKLYEKDGTYLAEAAQLIVRNVNYEVPAIKKQIGKCQQTQKECARKEKDYATSAVDLRKQYTTSCKELGIQGDKIKTELASLVKDLPSQLREFAESAKSLDDAVQFYDRFSSFLTGDETTASENVKLLKHLIEKGNTTTFEWRTGREPAKVEDQTISIDVSDEQEDAAEGGVGDIDWGAVDSGDAEIDFGDGGIDFDVTDITIESGGVLVTEGEVVLENPDIDAIDWEVIDNVAVESAAKDAGNDVASGQDALSIIDNPETRNNFVDDLLEIQAFLTQRTNELNKDTDGSHLSSAPSNIHLDLSTVADMLTKVKDILDQLTSVQMQHLLLIRDSPRYVDRLRDSLRQKLVLADKMGLSEKEMAGTRQEAVKEEKELEPQLNVFRSQTKVIKKQLEEEISKKYNSRKVNIIGEVNTL